MAETGYDYDLFVIGAGSGGVRASRVAAELGARVGVAEEYRVGGTCVIRGCIPKKLMVYAAHFSEDFADAAGYGWRLGQPAFDWAAFIANKDAEIDRLNGLYWQTLQSRGVEVFEERARIEDRHTVTVGGKTVTAGTILVATGGTPKLPDIPGAEHAITSNEAFHLDARPDHIVIVGGGYIAVEFASIFRGLGSRVTLIYRGEQILRGFDGDLRAGVQAALAAKGVDVRCETNVTAIEKTGEGLSARLTDGESLAADQVMMAVGRSPNTAGLGLEELGVGLDKSGAVQVDAYSQSNVDSIWAVGDVTDRLALTPVAIKEGHAFALTRFHGRPVQPDHREVASAVFSIPPFATVGMREEEAAAELADLDVYTADFKPLRHSLAGREERAFAKVLVEPAGDRVVGLHMLGPEAPEIVQGFAVALKNGLTKAQLDSTVAIHPTSAEEFVLMRTKRA